MEGKGKIIFPVIVTGIIVFIVSFLVTFLNIGFRANFVFLWLKAFVTAWPLAALVAFFAIRSRAASPSALSSCSTASCDRFALWISHRRSATDRCGIHAYSMAWEPGRAP